jgi:hypothetical protein
MFLSIMAAIAMDRKVTIPVKRLLPNVVTKNKVATTLGMPETTPPRLKARLFSVQNHGAPHPATPSIPLQMESIGRLLTFIKIQAR